MPGLSVKITEIPIHLITPSPHQTREQFDEESMQELANSIRENSLLQPIVVRPKGEEYVLVYGERRWRACRMLGWETIPAVVKEVDTVEAAELTLVENIQRENLTCIEEARAMKLLLDLHDGNRSEIAKKLGKSLPYIYERLALLQLPVKVQGFLEKGNISLAQAKVIGELQNSADQLKAAELAVRLNLSANELRGRLQPHLQKDKKVHLDRGPREFTSYPRLTTSLVAAYDALTSFDYKTLYDETKRSSLRKQIELLQGILKSSLVKISLAGMEGGMIVTQWREGSELEKAKDELEK